MFIRVISIVVLSFMLLSTAASEEREGDYLYKVSTVRAATGSLSYLLDWIGALNASDYFEDAGEHQPLVMRHTQGDQWDLMIITPMQSWSAYFSEEAVKQREAAFRKHAELLAPVDKLIAFDEDTFAYGPALPVVTAAFHNNGFFHIEMFKAAPGKTEELFEQRRMENNYLEATGQVTSMIFGRAAGSDVDVFTIGFHKSFEAFAAPASVSDDDKEVAAKEAGFKDRADLSFYLRSLISSHHDTLAVKVD
ncbi:MAG: hypothetical protein AAFN78_06965 [Pseudomonadota bacterium]